MRHAAGSHRAAIGAEVEGDVIKFQGFGVIHGRIGFHDQSGAS